MSWSVPEKVARPLVFGIFALSGCAGLIYQSIWTQYLGLFLGHAAYAQSLVLAIFMGGMAVGAWWTSVRAIHWRNLLRAYAWTELAIGLTALVFHPGYLAVTGFAYEVALPELSNGWAAQSFKWISGTLLILPQAVLLGATFPLFSTGLMRRQADGGGAVLSGLYFANSGGAAVGALVATFVLLPLVGMPGAMRFGALLNITVAAITFVLAKEAPPAAERATQAAVGTPARGRLLLGAAFVTGLTSFVYEIGWVRMLTLALGSTVHAFELMLAAFVGGLAFGAIWIRRRIDGFANPVRIAGHVQILMGLAALSSLLLYNYSFDWVAWFMGGLARSHEGYALFNVVTMSTAMLIMVPTAFFAGMTLPLFTVALIRKGGGEASVGRIYAADTIGAIVGVFFAVHLLIPTFGLKLTMIGAAAGDLALGIVLLRGTADSGRSKQDLAAFAACGVALAAAMVLANFDPLAMTGGVYRSGIARIDHEHARVLFYRDGKTASVASYVRDDGTAMIATNGKIDASLQLNRRRPATGDEVTMVMAAALPLALHPRPRTAAVIGFGSGLSTDTLLGDKRLERVDTIEIEPAMYDGARIFGDRVERAYRDPRSHVRFDDAKTYFAANHLRYDIILSEPSNPWVSGVASLFSREFYRFIPRHLTSDGLLVQWVQQYEITDELVATVVRALAESFASFHIYLANNSDMLIVAKVSGPISDIGDEIFQQAGLRTVLDRVGLNSAADLRVRAVGDQESMLPLFNVLSSRSNSDFFPILSLEAPRARFESLRAEVLLDLNLADLPMREVLAGVPSSAYSTAIVNSGYSPTVFASQAAQLAVALRDAAPLGKTPDETMQGTIAFVRAAVGQCQSADNGVSEVDALTLLAARTIPYLDSDHLKGVWSHPTWIACQTQPEPVTAILKLLDSMSRREFGETRTLALALLDRDKRLLSSRARDWLLRAAMLAAIAEKDYGDVSRIDTSVGKDIVANSTTGLQRAYLLAFADARQTQDKHKHSN